MRGVSRKLERNERKRARKTWRREKTYLRIQEETLGNSHKRNERSMKRLGALGSTKLRVDMCGRLIKASGHERKSLWIY